MIADGDSGVSELGKDASVTAVLLNIWWILKGLEESWVLKGLEESWILERR